MYYQTLTKEELQTLSYYDEHAKEWAGKRKKKTEPSFWREEYQILKSLAVPQGKILEIGSGSGREAPELMALGYDYAGVDSSRELLKIAASANPLNAFLYATPYSLPFDPSTFNAFSSWALLPHVPKERLSAVLQELKHVLKPDAIGFFAMREGTGFRQEIETGRWFSYYDQDELDRILQNQGFQIEKKGKKPSRPGLIWLTYFIRHTI